MLNRSTGAPRSLAARWPLAALSAAMALSSLGTSIVNVALPALAEAFSASFQEAQWMVLSYLLSITTLVVGAGRLGDIFGRRRLLLAGIFLFAAASLLCAAAPATWLLILGRAVQGLGAAIMMALSLALAAEAAPKAGIGGAVGVLGTMSAVGTALGPSLGGFLVAGFGWRAIFLVLAALAILSFTLVIRHLPADERAARPARASFDTTGTLLLALALAGYALAVTIGRGSFGYGNFALLLAGASAGLLFLRRQSRAPSPLIPLAMVRDSILAARLGTAMLAMTVMMATLVVGPFYLSRGLGLDAAGVGLVMTAGPAVAALAGAPAGRLADRLDAGRAILAGLAAMAAACSALAVLPSSLGVPGYLGPLVLLTAGYALFQAANNSALLRDIGPERRGVASAMLQLARNLGLITGASLMGAVFALASGASGLPVPDAASHGMQATFAVAAALLAAAIAFAQRAWRRSPGLATG